MKKIAAILLATALLLCGCGEKETTVEQTTVQGMVISVDGTKVELMSTEGMTTNRPSRGESDGENNYTRPQGGNRPEGDFTMPEGFEGFNGQMPEGFEGFNGQMPEGFDGSNMPSFGGQRPEGMTRPEGNFTMPEGFGEGEMPTMPEGFGGGNRFNSKDMETTTIDLKDAHISVEIDGGKAAGSMSDVTVGSQLTITMEGDKAVNVLVAQRGFGGFGGQGGFGGFGGFGGNRGNRGEKNGEQTKNS